MTGKPLITVLGATGIQGGSVINTVLFRPDLYAKYALRAVTRDPSSDKSQALAARGVEVVKANIDDVTSLQAAFSGAWGVFGLTDSWSTMSKEAEIEQGKAIFFACQSAGVKQLVWSSAPNVSKLSEGKNTRVHHFDSKAEVQDFIEVNKGNMLASYFMPAMYTDNIKTLIKDHGHGLTLALPFPDPDIPIPYIAAGRDSGKFVMGLFEAGDTADGAKVQGVSFWTTPNKLVAELSAHIGQEVRFASPSGEVFASFLPEAMKDPITDMLLWIGEESYYGLGSEKKQADCDAFLVKDADLQTIPTFAKEQDPWV